MADENFPRFAWLHSLGTGHPVLVNLTHIAMATRLPAHDGESPHSWVSILGEETPLTAIETPEEIARMLGAAEIDNGR